MHTPTLTRSWRNSVVALHIAASVGVLGADLVLIVLVLAGMSGADPLTVYPAARLVGASIIAPLALTALASGIALGLMTSWGLFKHWWVTIKLALTTALSLVLLFILIPGLESVAQMAAAGAPTSPRPLLLAGPIVASVILLLAIALSAFKPRWRLRGGDAR